MVFDLISFKKIFSCLILIFLAAVVTAQETTVINIINSQKTEYKKDNDTGNETIILEGAVELSVTKGGVKTNVTADSVSYDRVTKMLYAKGNIHLTTEGSAAGDENVTAHTLIMNTETLEGVFDGGRVIQTQSDAINLPSGSTLVVFSSLFGKSESNVLSFKNASMTFCDDDDPHWKINASRMWLLPGGEFAFLNALLYVGKVPVLYLPAFYYPKDELLFNPVFGFKNRPGYYVQTTTYLLGRKGAGKSSTSSSSSSDDDAQKALDSLYSFMNTSSMKEQVREGLVLHNLDEDYKGDTSRYIKLIADWYSNLGFITGLEGNIAPKNNYISKLVFALDLGFTNAVFNEGTKYSKFSNEGLKYKESSDLFTLKLPFRYKGNFEFGLSKPFNISLSLPVYSDPFFGNELNNRLESLNWISALKEYLEADDSQSDTISEVSSFAWNYSMSWSPNLPKFMKPYINSLSFSSSSSVNISSITTDREYLNEMNGSEWASVTSQRRFYYPSMITPANGNVSLSGTLFKYSYAGKSESNSTSKKTDFELVKPDFLLDKDEEITGSTEEKSLEEITSESNMEEEASVEEENYFLTNFKKTEITASSENQRKIPGLEYSLSYNVNPSVNSQLAYSSELLKSPEDFDWKKIRSSMYSVKVPVSLNNTMTYGGSFLSLSNRFSYDSLWQGHPYILDDVAAGGYSEASIKSMKKTDYAAEKQDILNINSLSIKPFAYLPVVTDTSLSWNSNIKLFRREFIGDDENPEWENHTAKWDDESITINSLTLNLTSTELDNKFKQSLNFTASLPPLTDKYTVSTSFTFPYVNASFGTGFYKEKDAISKEKSKEFKFNPLQQSLSFSNKIFGSNLSFSESYNYNIEDKKHESFKTSVSWFNASLSYTMSDSYTYDFDPEKGWVQEEEKSFVPYSISGSYSIPSKTFYTWKNRLALTPNLSSSVVADLVRPTNSYFVFSPSVSLKLNSFLTLTFSSTSRNSVIYRYFQGMMGNEGRVPGETNIIKDLLNSFRFDNIKLRQASGFKLKSLNMSLEHELHDWKMKMNLKIEPRLLTENGKKYYDFSPYFNFGIVWSPMEAIKTSVVDEYGEWKLD